MVFEFVSGIGEKATKICGDVKGGFSRFDRFTVTRSVSTRTIINDTAKGKKLVDTEDCYTQEFSLLKFVLSVVLVIVSMTAFLLSCRSSAKQKRKLKEQKKELRKIKKLCRKADIEIPHAES